MTLEDICHLQHQREICINPCSTAEVEPSILRFNSSKSSSKEPVSRLNGLNTTHQDKSDQNPKEVLRQTGSSKCPEEGSQRNVKSLDGSFLNQVKISEEKEKIAIDDINLLRKENAELKERIKQLEADQELVLQLNQLLLEKLHLFSDDFFTKPMTAL